MLPRYKQGDFDGLCGLYAAVNGINELLGTRIDRDINEDWFKHLASSVDRRLYPEVLWDGLTREQLLRAVRKTCAEIDKRTGLHIQARAPFTRATFSSRDTFLNAVHQLLLQLRCVFLLFVEWPMRQGGGAHWTVLKDIESDHLRLVDSGKESKLPLRRLGIGSSRGTRLDPQNTIMLTLTQIDGKPPA